MIISASRRTDIPAFYSEWFFNRLIEQYVLVRNPVNLNQVGRICLSPEVVDCIVFWSKDPAPMMKLVEENKKISEILKQYDYYIQFTLNAYGPEIEGGLPPLERRIETMKRLAEAVGRERVLWRYDPIAINEDYPVGFHIETFGKLAEALRESARRCTISFLDLYAKTEKQTKRLGLRAPDDEEILLLADGIAAAKGDLEVCTCAEDAELGEFGIGRGACVDKRLVEELTGFRIRASKDRYQRKSCGCMESIDIGTYNTCLHCCAYCYADHSPESVIKNAKKFDPASPVLCGLVSGNETVKERKMKSLKDGQQHFSWE